MLEDLVITMAENVKKFAAYTAPKRPIARIIYIVFIWALFLCVVLALVAAVVYAGLFVFGSLIGITVGFVWNIAVALSESALPYFDEPVRAFADASIKTLVFAVAVMFVAIIFKPSSRYGLLILITLTTSLLSISLLWGFSQCRKFGVWDSVLNNPKGGPTVLTNSVESCEYFMVVTATTIGFGDLVPSIGMRSSVMLIAAASYIFIGIFMSLLIALISNMLASAFRDEKPAVLPGLPPAPLVPPTPPKPKHTLVPYSD